LPFPVRAVECPRPVSRLNLKREVSTNSAIPSSRTIQVTFNLEPRPLRAESEILMPSTGTLNVTIVDANQQLWPGPRVRLVLTDPFTNASKPVVDKTLEQGQNNPVINDIPTDAGQTYILMVDADGHRSHSVFPVKPIPNAVTPINIMLIPNDPVPDFSRFNYNELKLRSPQFHTALSAGVSESDFFSLAEADPEFGLERMSTILNIEAKLRATALKQGHAVDFIQHFKDVSSCEPDRLKVEVKPDMPENVRGLKTFTELNPDVNEMNHKGFPISFKQKLTFCSLQLSFKKDAEAGLLSADVDIDLLTDIGHFGEVIKNKVTKTKTDPFNIYVMLSDQNIRPLYTLKV
jgi:hypothetical protein